MPTLNENWILRFNEFLKGVTWNRHLAAEIQDYLNGQNYSSKTIDKLLMAITKLVETELKDAVRRFTGAETPPNIHGKDLLNYARKKGLISEPKRGTDCLYSLIYWYMSKPRDTSHHVFTSFPLPTLLLFVSTANYILDEIDRLTKGNQLYNAKIVVGAFPSHKFMVSVSDVVKGSEPTDILNMEILLSAPDKSIRTIPLISKEKQWITEINTYGYMEGTYRIDMAGYTQNKERFVLTGSTIVVVS